MRIRIVTINIDILEHQCYHYHYASPSSIIITFINVIIIIIHVIVIVIVMYQRHHHHDKNLPVLVVSGMLYQDQETPASVAGSGIPF